MPQDDNGNSSKKPEKGTGTLSIFARMHAAKPKVPPKSKEIQLALGNINNRLKVYSEDKVKELSNSKNQDQLLNLIEQLNSDMEILSSFLKRELNPKDTTAIEETEDNIHNLMELIEKCIDEEE